MHSSILFLENPHGPGAWPAIIVHGVSKSQTRLSTKYTQGSDMQVVTKYVVVVVLMTSFLFIDSFLRFIYLFGCAGSILLGLAFGQAMAWALLWCVGFSLQWLLLTEHSLQ